MIKANNEIREALNNHKMTQYQLADKLGITECMMSKMLKNELNPEDKLRLLKIIEEDANYGNKDFNMWSVRYR